MKAFVVSWTKSLHLVQQVHAVELLCVQQKYLIPLICSCSDQYIIVDFSSQNLV